MPASFATAKAYASKFNQLVSRERGKSVPQAYARNSEIKVSLDDNSSKLRNWAPNTTASMAAALITAACIIG